MSIKTKPNNHNKKLSQKESENINVNSKEFATDVVSIKRVGTIENSGQTSSVNIFTIVYCSIVFMTLDQN